MNKPDRNEYTGISNKLFLDNELTLTEKGLLCQIASVPYGTVLTLADIKDFCNDSIWQINITIRSLIDRGKLQRDAVYGDDGHLLGHKYYVSYDSFEDAQDCFGFPAKGRNAQ